MPAPTLGLALAWQDSGYGPGDMRGGRPTWVPCGTTNLVPLLVPYGTTILVLSGGLCGTTKLGTNWGHIRPSIGTGSPQSVPPSGALRRRPDPPPSPPEARISLHPISIRRRLICDPGLCLRILDQGHLRALACVKPTGATTFAFMGPKDIYVLRKRSRALREGGVDVHYHCLPETFGVD